MFNSYSKIFISLKGEKMNIQDEVIEIIKETNSFIKALEVLKKRVEKRTKGAMTIKNGMLQFKEGNI